MTTSVLFDIAALLERYLPKGRLEAYYDLLMQANQKVNLVSRETSRTDFDRMVAECLLPLDQFDPNLRFGQYLDIGSGGGLPLVPLMLTGRFGSAVAVERTGKKARALAELCAALELPVRMLDRTIEEVKTKRTFDLITLRYVKLTEPLAQTIGGLLSRRAHFIYYSSVSLPLKQFEITRRDFTTGPDQPAKSFSIISLKA